MSRIDQLRARLSRAGREIRSLMRSAGDVFVWRAGQYALPLALALYANRKYLGDRPSPMGHLPSEPWVTQEQRELLARSEQRLQSIESKGPGLATVCAVVAAAVTVALSLTWKEASTLARALLILAGAYVLMSLYTPIRLVGPVRRATITAQDLSETAASTNSEALLGERYAEAAAANDHETLRLSNLQAASRNDLVIATVLFGVWGILAIAGCAK